MVWCTLLAILIAGILLHTPPHAQPLCSAASTGSPCATGGVATLGARELTLNARAGNPVHALTGNKYQYEPDWPAHPAHPGIELVRHYNSQDTRASLLGRGWQFSYDTRLLYAGGQWQVIQADGSRIQPAPPNGQLLAQTNGWHWQWPDGRLLHFNTHGYLTAIQFPQPEVATIHIERMTGTGPLQHAIHSVSREGRTHLRFHYDTTVSPARLAYVATTVGRFIYTHDTPEAQEFQATTRPVSHRLRAVRRPDGMQHTYEYDARLQQGHPFSLTGLIRQSATDTAGQSRRESIGTWQYDAYNRVRQWTAGQARPDTGTTLTFDYDSLNAGHGPEQHTLIQSDQGQETRISGIAIGDTWKVTSIEHTPCTDCGRTQQHARYTQAGLLQKINGTTLHRTPQGVLQGLEISDSGWPGLHIKLGNHEHSWYSHMTGSERLSVDTQRRPVARTRANGHQTHITYDAVDRPVRILEHSIAPRSGVAPLLTRLHWQGRHLTQVTHPHETEHRRYDSLGQMTERYTIRPAPAGDAKVRLSERFEYDAQGQLTRHHLPEGGRLDYLWHTTADPQLTDAKTTGLGQPHPITPRIARIIWTDTTGKAHTVITSTPATPGYRYGNELVLRPVMSPQGQAHMLTLHDGDTPRWTLERRYDTQRSTLTEHATLYDPQRGHDVFQAYTHDAQGRLQGAHTVVTPHPTAARPLDELTRASRFWYAWSATGALHALQHNNNNNNNNNTVYPVISRDAAGLPVQVGSWATRYGPDGRLQQATHTTQGVSARYTHNAFGHLIRRDTAHETLSLHYLSNQLVAEQQWPSGNTGNSTQDTNPMSRRYIYAGRLPVGLIQYSPATAGHTAGSGQLLFIHTDWLGAPRLVTDTDRNVQWAAYYGPTGEAHIVHEAITLELRLPGQRHDALTGWHDNLLRTYDPAAGHYLEPDPIGPLPGTQALGYAGQRPQSLVDPLGLILFAFDGSRQDSVTQSNVWKLGQAYQDGQVHYQKGPGNSYYLDWDALTAVHAGQIVENQWQHFLNQVERHQRSRETLTVDVIGFSRGASLARHFGNQIASHTRDGRFNYTDRIRGNLTACIDLRFMGLFDTVAQFGPNGLHNHRYDLTVAQAWQWVAHAVALQEHRALFPVHSALDTQATNVVEAPFIGAHADIGGGNDNPQGMSTPPLEQGDLSDITLNWMAWQAHAVQVNLRLKAEDLSIDRPIVHDERAAWLRTLQNGDRAILGAAGHTLHTYQQDHDRLGALAREQTESLIQRNENWRWESGRNVGAVDMDGYARWLHDELGWQPGT